MHSNSSWKFDKYLYDREQVRTVFALITDMCYQQPKVQTLLAFRTYTSLSAHPTFSTLLAVPTILRATLAFLDSRFIRLLSIYTIPSPTSQTSISASNFTSFLGLRYDSSGNDARSRIKS